MADARLHRLLPAPLRRDRPAAPLTRPVDRRHALARRADRGTGRRRARRRNPRRARARGHGGVDVDRRHEPRLPARRRAPALGRLRRLLAHGLDGPAAAGFSSGSACSRRRSRTAIYLFQSADGTYVEGTWIDILWPTALLLIAVVGLGARPHARRPRGRRATAARRAGGVRARRHRDPRVRPLHSLEPARDRPRVGDARRSSSCASRPRSGRTAVSSS